MAGEVARLDQRAVLEARAAASAARLDRLRRDRAAIVATVASDNVDDEHDPDGATLAWEREQLAALIADEQRTLAGVTDALARLEDGDYGRCEHCGGAIPDGRLAVRPHARRCVPCAEAGR